MGRNRKNNYKEVDKLPTGAQPVSEYANNWPCNTSYIYKLYRDGKHSGRFDIVLYKGFNFVIPCNN